MQIRSIVAATILLSGFAAAVSAGPLEDMSAAWDRLKGGSGSTAKAPDIAAATGPVAQGEAAYQKGDYATALRLWLAAANQEDARAQFNLGVIHANGRGVPQDYVVAHMWFNLSAARGDNTAAEYRDKIAKEMSATQIADAQKMARDWKPNRSFERKQNRDQKKATSEGVRKPAAASH